MPKWMMHEYDHILEDLQVYVIAEFYSESDLSYIRALATAMGASSVKPYPLSGSYLPREC